MIRHRWSLRSLIGGIYFFIMVTILGALALYFSQLTAQDYMKMMNLTLRKQAMLGAYLLKPLAIERKKPLARIEEIDRAIAADTKGIPGAWSPRMPRLQHEKTDLLTALYGKDGKEDGQGGIDGRIKGMLRGIHSRTVARQIMLIDLNGSLIEASFTIDPDTNIIQPEVQQVLRGEMVGNDIRYNRETNEEILFTAVPVLSKGNASVDSVLPGWTTAKDAEEIVLAHYPPRVLAILVLATSTTPMYETTQHIRGAILLAFIGAILVLFFINAGISNFISQPLATLSAAAERFAHGGLTERIVPSGAQEIASLGDSLNRMAEQLRGTITRLAEERAQAEAILASMVDGVLVTDPQGTIVLINHSAELICNLQQSAVIGKTLPEVAIHYELHGLLQKTLTSGVPLKHEITFTQPTEQVIEVHLAPVEVDERQLGVVIVLYDITHQRKLEQVRRDFVANVSHELRTPVASIRAMAETLFDAGCDDPEMATEFLGTIIKESERLTALLDNLLQLSRIESGRHPLTLEPIELCAVIRHVAERVIAPITAKGQHLVLELPEAVPIIADHHAIIQILVNLLDNARKYSPEGGTITVSVEAGDVVRIQVTDSGIGIPAEDLERIFERFYRVDKARSRAQGGTGLGLSIVKHLLELHGGRLFVESDLGVGSCFTVELPQRKPEDPVPEEAGKLPSGLQVSAVGGTDTPG